MPKSWAAEVVADETGKWAGNALRFATVQEAESWVADLAGRWILVRGTRVVPSDDPVNYKWDGTNLTEVAPE